MDPDSGPVGTAPRRTSGLLAEQRPATGASGAEGFGLALRLWREVRRIGSGDVSHTSLDGLDGPNGAGNKAITVMNHSKKNNSKYYIGARWIFSEHIPHAYVHTSLQCDGEIRTCSQYGSKPLFCHCCSTRKNVCWSLTSSVLLDVWHFKLCFN